MASMRDIKRPQEQYYQYTADYQSHEAGIHGKAAEDKGTCGAVQAVF